MGYGSGSGDSNKSITFFKVEGLKLSAEELYFKGSAKNQESGKYEIISEKPTYIQGMLTAVKTDSYEYDGDIIHTVSLQLDDVDERCILEMNVASNMATSLINTLAGSEGISDLKLALYTSNSGYASMFIEADAGMTKCQWAWDYKGIIEPLIGKVKLGQKTLTDKTKLVEFLVSEINKPEFQKKYSTGAPVAETQTTVEDKPQKPKRVSKKVKDIEVKGFEKVEVPKKDEEPDDLPF